MITKSIHIIYYVITYENKVYVKNDAREWILNSLVCIPIA